MSDSVRPHRRQPTRLPHPWDSPGKNTGVGCHFLLQWVTVKTESEVAQSCLTQRPQGLQPTRLLRPWDFPGKSTGVQRHREMVKYAQQCNATGPTGPYYVWSTRSVLTKVYLSQQLLHQSRNTVLLQNKQTTLGFMPFY